MPHRGPRGLTSVIVTDGDERSALAIVRSLGRTAKYEVHVCSSSGRSLAGASRYARSDSRVGTALADATAFAHRVAELARSVGASVIMPVSEASVLAVFANRELFAGFTIPIPNEASFRDASDKATVLEAARAVGLSTPAQHVVHCAADVAALIEQGGLAFPVVIKPARSVVSTGRSWSKVGVSYASDPNELRARVGSYDADAFPLLLQQRIIGHGVGVFLLRWNGETLASFSHRRLREKPPSGGVSVCSESIAVDASLLAKSQALLDRFGWRGVAMIEFKVDDRTGTPYLMEINGRFWGSLQLAITAGVDFPALLAAAAIGDRPEPVHEFRLGVRNRWWWGEVDHLLARLRHSDRELALPPGSPSRLRTVLDLLRWRGIDHNETLQRDDRRPFLRETARWFRGR